MYYILLSHNQNGVARLFVDVESVVSVLSATVVDDFMPEFNPLRFISASSAFETMKVVRSGGAKTMGSVPAATWELSARDHALPIATRRMID